MTFKTTDLCDAYPEALRVSEPVFRDFGRRRAFHGAIATVRTFEDNTLVRAALEEAGNGRVLVVDGGGSLRRALLGDNLASLGAKNGWQGAVVFGCVRDTADLAGIEFGVKALAPHPRKSEKNNYGEAGVPVEFAGLRFVPGHYCYADEDGIVIAERALSF